MILTLISAVENEDGKTFMLNLYKDYYPLVRKTVYNILHDQKEIDDLIYDTFMKLIEKIPLLRTFESCKMTAYIVYTS